MKSRTQRPKSRVIVVAENNVESRAAVCNLVEQLNCVAVPAVSVLEVMKMTKNRHVDLVLLDIDQVWSEEVDSVSAIRQIDPLLPIVMMSRLTTPAMTRRMCDRGVQSFLGKPVQRDQLAMTLFRYLL
jgi:DNA-binding NtrC family response regulator